MNEGVHEQKGVRKQTGKWGQVTGGERQSRPGCQPGLWDKSNPSLLVRAKSKGEGRRRGHHLTASKYHCYIKNQTGGGRWGGARACLPCHRTCHTQHPDPAKSQNLLPPWDLEVPVSLPSHVHPSIKELRGRRDSPTGALQLQGRDPGNVEELSLLRAGGAVALQRKGHEDQVETPSPSAAHLGSSPGAGRIPQSCAWVDVLQEGQDGAGPGSTCLAPELLSV